VSWREIHKSLCRANLDRTRILGGRQAGRGSDWTFKGWHEKKSFSAEPAEAQSFAEKMMNLTLRNSAPLRALR